MWTFGVFLGLLSMAPALGTRAFLGSPLSARLPLMASAPSPMPWWQSSVAGGFRLCFSVLVREFCFVKLWGLHLGSVVHQSLPQSPQTHSSTWVRSSVDPLLGPGTRALTGNSEAVFKTPPPPLWDPALQQTNKQTKQSPATTQRWFLLFEQFLLDSAFVWWLWTFFFTVFLTSNRADTFCLGCWYFCGGVALRDAYSAFLLMFLGRSQECLNVVNKLWFWLAEWGWGLKLLGFRVSVHCNPINTRTMNTLTYRLCLCPYQIEPFLVRIFRHEHKVFQTLFAPCCQQ